jgi:hypothetical protein
MAVRRTAKIAIGAGAAVATWTIAVLVVGFAARGCVAERMRTRLAESLDADVRIRDLDLALVRGEVGFEGLAIDRDHDGHLHVGVDHLDAGIAPLGAYLWDRSLGRIRIDGVDLEVDGWGVLRIKPPRRPPVSFAGLAIDDARLVFAAALGAPKWARFAVLIDHAETGATILRTPLSWVFALERLDARLEVPGVEPVALHYANGRLDASGGPFGSDPVSIAVTLPAPEPGREGQQLEALGKDVAERLALARASGWINDEFGE